MADLTSPAHDAARQVHAGRDDRRPEPGSAPARPDVPTSLRQPPPSSGSGGTHRHGVTGQYVSGPSVPNAAVTHHQGGATDAMAASLRRKTLHGTPGHQAVAPGTQPAPPRNTAA